jgi:hypothetical protein
VAVVVYNEMIRAYRKGVVDYVPRFAEEEPFLLGIEIFGTEKAGPL